MPNASLIFSARRKKMEVRGLPLNKRKQEQPFKFAEPETLDSRPTRMGNDEIPTRKKYRL